MNEKVIKMIVEILDIEVDEVNKDASILDDLGADSIAIMEIVMEIETEFDIEVPTEDIIKLKTVNNILEYLESRDV